MYNKGKENQRIWFQSDGELRCIVNISNGWIYYNTWSSGIYRVKTDGTENTLIFDGLVGYPVFEGNYIYGFACDKKDIDMNKNYLLKLSLDGKEKIKLTNVKSTDRWTTIDVFAITDDWVYFALSNSWYRPDLAPKHDAQDTPVDYSLGLYRVSKDGGKAKKLYDFDNYWIEEFTLLDGWIYFLDINKKTGNEELYKIRENGKNKQLVEQAK
jgi:hypothetical protein